MSYAFSLACVFICFSVQQPRRPLTASRLFQTTTLKIGSFFFVLLSVCGKKLWRCFVWRLVVLSSVPREGRGQCALGDFLKRAHLWRILLFYLGCSTSRSADSRSAFFFFSLDFSVVFKNTKKRGSRALPPICWGKKAPSVCCLSLTSFPGEPYLCRFCRRPVHRRHRWHSVRVPGRVLRGGVRNLRRARVQPREHVVPHGERLLRQRDCGRGRFLLRHHDRAVYCLHR